MSASILYFFVHKFVCLRLARASPYGAESFELSTDILQKMQMFSKEILPLSFNFLPEHRELSFAIGILILCAFLVTLYKNKLLCRTNLLPIAVTMYLVTFYFGFINCVNLAAKGGTVAWRTISTSQVLGFGLLLFMVHYITRNHRRYVHIIFVTMLLALIWGEGFFVIDKTVGAWQAQINHMQTVVDDYFEKHKHFPQHIHTVMIDKENPKGHDVFPLQLYAWYQEPRPWANRVISKRTKVNLKNWVYEETPANPLAIVRVSYSTDTPPEEKTDDMLIVDLNEAFDCSHHR